MNCGFSKIGQRLVNNAARIRRVYAHATVKNKLLCWSRFSL
jgi:hypothetical protein